jgi:hypothetical protein
MTQLDSMKDMNNNEGLGKGNPKLGVNFLWGLKNIYFGVFFLFLNVLFSSKLLILPLVLAKWRLIAPVWGTL